MIAIAFESALRSIRKTPGVSALVVMAIALGVGITMPMVALYQNNGGNPIPEISDDLHRVLVENWKEDEPFRSRFPDMPTELFSGQDIRAIMKSDFLDDYSASYSLNTWVRSANNRTDTDGGKRTSNAGLVKPFFSSVRVTNSGFFRLFEVPMAFGRYWSDQQALDRSNVAVISRMTNIRLFGGGDNVGKTFRLGNEIYTVVGIVANWSLTPRVYDLSEANARPEGVYVPLSNFSRRELKPNLRWNVANNNPPENFDGAFLSSETIFAVLWVKFDSNEQKLGFKDYLDSYVFEQKSFGRLPKPINNRLYSATEWMDVAPELQGIQRLYSVFVVVGVLFLLVCLFNLLSLLLGKFMSVTPEACVIRALGASRSLIFTQYVIEVVLLGFIGGILSLGIAIAGLEGMLWIYLENIPPEFKLIQSPDGQSGYTQFDGSLLITSLLLAVTASVLCALYPAWKVCRIPPAEYLKMN